jgi:hypothetical protein
MIFNRRILCWKTDMRRRVLQVCIMLMSFAAVLPIAAAKNEVGIGKDPAPYRVVDGKVDESTFLGWRIYHSTCHGCHGVDATGTSVAPNLVVAAGSMTSREFSTKVLTRYRLVFGSDEITGDDQTALRAAFMEQVMRRESGELIMPAWGDNPNIQPHVLDLYAYLRARADGALGPGRPEKIPE